LPDNVARADQSDRFFRRVLAGLVQFVARPELVVGPKEKGGILFRQVNVPPRNANGNPLRVVSCPFLSQDLENPVSNQPD
jgi:hypothetical protein